MRSATLTGSIMLFVAVVSGCASAKREPPLSPQTDTPPTYEQASGEKAEEQVSQDTPWAPSPAKPAPQPVLREELHRVAGTRGDAVRAVQSMPSSDSAKTVAQAAPPGPPSPPPPPPPPPPQPAPKADPTQQQGAHDRDFVIYTAVFHIAVYQVDQGVGAVEKIGREMGGHLAKKGDREITIRVPRARFDAALTAIDKIGDVLHRDIQAQDVTDEHVDLEIRIKSARAMQKRLSDLLEKAPVKEALEIEKELHRVTEELERLEGKLKLLRDKIAYSTLTVLFQPRGGAIQVTRSRLPFPWLSALGLPTLLTLSEDK